MKASDYRIPERDELREGLQVTWLYEMRGGYGYTQPVPATVVKASAKRVSIDALKKDGSTVRRSVRRESLRVGRDG